MCCPDCFRKGMAALSPEQTRWMRHALQVGSASWVDTEEAQAPYPLLRDYVERRLDRPLRSASMLPK